MKTITLHAGHNPKGKIACGASDYLDESTEARWMVKKVKALLKKKGVRVYDCTVNNGTCQSDVLDKIITKCNAKQRDFDISIHFNAIRHETDDGKTKGVECCVYNAHSTTAIKARKICDYMSLLGFTNRGVKERKNLTFLRRTTEPAILIEVCFVDDEDDAKLYKKCKNDVAKAIADAIAAW